MLNISNYSISNKLIIFNTLFKNFASFFSKTILSSGVAIASIFFFNSSANNSNTLKINKLDLLITFRLCHYTKHLTRNLRR